VRKDAQITKPWTTETSTRTRVNAGCHAAFSIGTYPEKADFRQPLDFDIYRSANRMRRARFSADGPGGLSSRFDPVIE
jgi:hypothetical protein